MDNVKGAFMKRSDITDDEVEFILLQREQNRLIQLQNRLKAEFDAARSESYKIEQKTNEIRKRMGRDGFGSYDINSL
jgi:hypothetical protein